MWSLVTVILSFIPGVLGYDYSIGGMVASVTASVLLILPIIIMVLVILQWRDWYMKKQARKGRFRVPRKDWTTFKTKTKSIITVVSTPKSERRANLIRMYDIQGQPEEPNNTLPKSSDLYSNNFSRVRTPARYEEKVGTINFEPEEEPVFVADILPDETKQPAVHHISQSQSSTPYYIETQEEPSDMRTTVVRLGQDQQQQQQELRTSHQHRPYHVQLAQTTQDNNDIFISPMVPTSNTSITDDNTPLIRSTTLRQTQGNEAVMIFPSDEETENVGFGQGNTGVDVMF